MERALLLAAAALLGAPSPWNFAESGVASTAVVADPRPSLILADERMQTTAVEPSHPAVGLDALRMRVASSAPELAPDRGRL
jgi:hypothetical protein